MLLQNKNNEKNNDQESAATNIHINLHRVAHPLRGCISTPMNSFEHRQPSPSVLQRTQHARDTVNKRFLLNVEKDGLESAAGFDKDQRPNVADPSWEKGIHQGGSGRSS